MGYQLQADYAFEHMARRIDFYVQRPPQSGTHRRIVRRIQLFVVHNILSVCCTPHFDLLASARVKLTSNSRPTSSAV